MGVARPHKPGSGFSTRWVFLFCTASFFLGVLVVNRFWVLPDPPMKSNDESLKKQPSTVIHPMVDCDKKEASVDAGDILSQVSQTHNVIMTLDKTISSLEMQLAAARAAKADNDEELDDRESRVELSKDRPKVFFVMGIITAFSSRKRRDSIRETWMPKKDELKKLEVEKGIIIRFVIGHSASPGGVLDRAIDAEEAQHKDFLRLDHIEGYHELSSKTQTYFSTAVAKWDADFYIKVDDDVHINLGMVGSTLARHRSKPRVYIGCMSQDLSYLRRESSTMNLNSGNLARRETNTLGMQQGKYMQYLKIWQHIFQLIGIFSISMQMKMFLWVLGSSDLMSSTSMNGAYAVAPPLIASGRHRLGIHVRLHSIGVAAEFANLWKECRKSITGVVRARARSGTWGFSNGSFSVDDSVMYTTMKRRKMKSRSVSHLPDFCATGR